MLVANFNPERLAYCQKNADEILTTGLRKGANSGNKNKPVFVTRTDRQ